MQRTAPSKASKKKFIPARIEEMATPEREKQNGGVVREYVGEGNKVGANRLRHRARCECMLDWYMARGKLGRAEFDAGMRFRAAWLTKAEGIKTHDSTQPSLGGGEAVSAIERKTYSEIILKQAYAELSPSQALVIVGVCGQDEAAGDKDRLVYLRRGLEALARLWGLS